jgi:hypothetical protein
MFKHIAIGLIAVSYFVVMPTHAEKKKKNSCFESIVFSPSFIALETSFNSDLQLWYKNVFQLDTVKEFTFSDGRTKGSLMKRGDFIIEVFNKSSLEPSQKENSLGVMKFGFFVKTNLDDLKNCLISQNISAKRIFNDKNLSARLLLIEDPEGNHFEVIVKNN